MGGENFIELLQKGRNEYTEALQIKKRILQEVGNLVNSYTKIEQDLIEQQEKMNNQEKEEEQSSDSNESSKNQDHLMNFKTQNLHLHLPEMLSLTLTKITIMIMKMKMKILIMIMFVNKD